MHPKAASNRRSTSTGSAAPPDMHTRSELVSAWTSSAAPSSVAYIVGTPSNTVTFLSGNRFQHPSGIESRYQHQGGTRGHRRHKAARHPERVEQRQAAHHHVRRAERKQIAHDDRLVSTDVAVSQLSSLRNSCRSRGVQDHRGVVDRSISRAGHRHTICDELDDASIVDLQMPRAGSLRTAAQQPRNTAAHGTAPRRRYWSGRR